MDKFDEKLLAKAQELIRAFPVRSDELNEVKIFQALRDVAREEREPLKRIYDLVTHQLAMPTLGGEDTGVLTQIATICEEVMPTDGGKATALRSPEDTRQMQVDLRNVIALLNAHMKACDEYLEPDDMAVFQDIQKRNPVCVAIESGKE